jgi:hypothetical protein
LGERKWERKEKFEEKRAPGERSKTRMSYVLRTLATKREVDEAIRNTDDLLLVLRFGRADDTTCLQLDEIVPPSN